MTLRKIEQITLFFVKFWWWFIQKNETGCADGFKPAYPSAEYELSGRYEIDQARHMVRLAEERRKAIEFGNRVNNRRESVVELMKGHRGCRR